MKKNIITHSELLKNFHLDESTWILSHRTKKMSSNGKSVKNKKGSQLKYHISSHGYKTGSINGDMYRLHILVFYYITGKYPDYKIKFKDNDRLNIEFDNMVEQKPLYVVDKKTGQMLKICITCGAAKLNNTENFKLKWLSDKAVNTCKSCEAKDAREKRKRKSGKPLVFDEKLKEWIYECSPSAEKKKVVKKKVVVYRFIKKINPLTKEEKAYQKIVLKEIKLFNKLSRKEMIRKEDNDFLDKDLF